MSILRTGRKLDEENIRPDVISLPKIKSENGIEELVRLIWEFSFGSHFCEFLSL